MDSKSKHNSGVRKRPEMALYKPGMGRIGKSNGKKGDNELNVPQKQDFSEEQKHDLRQRNDEKVESIQNDSKDNKQNNNNKIVNKKPDIQVYVPRKLNNNNNNNNENSDKYSDKEKPIPEKVTEKSKQNVNQNQYERRQQNPRPANNHKKYDQKIVERNTSDNSYKTSDNYDNYGSIKRKDNKVNDICVNYEENRKSESIEPKINQNINQNVNNRVSKAEKTNFNEEFDDNYYNHDFKGRNFKNQRHNRNSSNSNFSNSNNNNTNMYTNSTSNNSSNTYESVGHKSRLKHDNAKQRNYSSNKPQHRYQYEQQIPPRFLKKQQLLKQQMENENVSQQPQQESVYEQQRPEPLQQSLYEHRRQEPLQQQTQHSNDSESFPHRGLIRLPTNNQITGEGLHPRLNQKQEHHNIGSQFRFDTKSTLNPNKPCVAIRPTQHVSADNYPQYSPSSSPDGNQVFTTPSVDNYQQLSPYLRSNYSEYPINNFGNSVENDFSRILNSSEMSRKKLKPIIEKSFSEAITAENDLQLYINDQQKVEQIRYRIQLRYEHIILTDLKVCAEYNIEQRLWKSAFYQFIEHYRRLMEQNSEQQSEMKTSLHKIVDEASLFFENLLVKMQETYNFAIEKLLSHEYDRQTENYDSLKLAAISAQKIYLYLGDLSRYKECEVRNSNFAKSKFYYVRAQMLAPKNGRSYNQLALLAMYQNRRLDAVYYYMRSLAASNPFLTARENLLAIFDEVRRKYELTEKKRKQDLVKNKNRIKEELLASDNERTEIWIRSDGSSAICSNYKQFFEEETNGEELEMMSSIDLNKRFVLSFLHVHGKLFSKVGMETFVPVVNQMLSEFNCLLRRSPIPVSSHRLTQLLAINMFAVFHTTLKDPSYGNNCRSLLQEQAIQVTFAMISLLLKCGINSLHEHKRDDTHPNFNNDDLSELLPTIKLWTDWMSCQKQLWCPSPAPSDFNFNCKGDIWTIFAEFLTALTKINVRSAVKLLPSKLEGCEPVILPEDTSLAGFLPLLGSPQCVQYAQPPYDKEKARTCLRITVIQFFGDYLCGIVEPYLKFDVERKRFVSLIPTSIQSNSKHSSKRNSSEDISETETDDYQNDSSSAETTSNTALDCNLKSPEQLELEELWSRQESLKKAKERQEMIKQRVDAVLNEENQSKPSRIIIQPRYIIADTNCFIDHLDQIKALINSGYYDLIVPLIVINELNGLKSRGVKTLKPLTFSDDHNGQVGKSAMDTIDYLISAFNNKSNRLKAITSKGSILDNINFISETFNETQGNSNDDFILSACLQFIKDKPLDKSHKELVSNSVESNSIFREAILLTEDRNLRVKALGHNVPVKSLPVFIKWANIPIKPNRV